MSTDDTEDLSGLPDPDSPEPQPLGAVEGDADGEGEPSRGTGAMPGIPDEGVEPPTDG
jgi:hypothetical protein